MLLLTIHCFGNVNLENNETVSHWNLKFDMNQRPLSRNSNDISILKFDNIYLDFSNNKFKGIANFKEKNKIYKSMFEMRLLSSYLHISIS